ncbi:putative EAL-domain containing protein YkuI [compost metagenome]
MYVSTSDTKIPLKREVAPYFQPIVSLQNQQIFGYETLGRRVQQGKIESLGPFFKDPTIADENHLHIDRHLREMAIKKMAAEDPSACLFINLKPSWIFATYQTTGVLITLEIMKKYHIHPSRVVIEITEEEFMGHLQELTEVIHLYRQAGCRIAIDDVGSGFSNFDRIASIQPNILKIDLNILKKSATHSGYKALMQSFSILAAQMGASLLVEGVETKQDLQNALHASARYVQGYLFSPAMAELQQADTYKDMLKIEMGLYSQEEFVKYRRLFAVQESLEHLVNSSVAIQSVEEADHVIERTLTTITDNCMRIYICREDGYQISSNYTRKHHNWHKDESFQGSNWIWRPYFIANVLIMNMKQQGTLSQVYADLDSLNLIQTFSCPLGEGFYLFLDLSI